MASIIYRYNYFKKSLLEGEIDFSDPSQTFKVSLHSNLYTPDIDTHITMDDVTNEISGTGYVQGGKTITNLTTLVDTITDKVIIMGDDVEWTGSTLTARSAIIYKYVDPTPSNNLLIACIYFDSDKSTTSDSFLIQWTDGKILLIN